jgi:lipoprotein-releasing system ATP-binding protein
MLELNDVYKEFPTRGEPLRVLRGITLELGGDEAMAITGPSGSGKSTLLNVIGTLERPTSGTVKLDGNDPFGLSQRQLAAFRNTAIGFIFQDHHLLPQCTVLENVLIPRLAGSGIDAEARQRAAGLVERVGLSGRLDHRPAELSGGERQRVAVARALVNEPQLVLADEPTGNLDHVTAESVADLLLQLQSETQSMLIVVTHSLELAGRFGRRCEMRDGTLQEGSHA